MDNPEEIAYQVLIDKYLADNAKFKQGSVVYFEHMVHKNNQQHIKLSVGIVTEISLRKRLVERGEHSYETHDIVYDIVSPKGLFKSVGECKVISASEFIYREYLKQQPR